MSRNFIRYCIIISSMGIFLNAKTLEESIKNVDVSGYATYRYNDRKQKLDGISQSSEQDQIYKLGLRVYNPINDDVDLEIKAYSRNEFEESSSDKNIPVKVEHINFNYTAMENLSIKLGKLPIDTPWTYASSNILITNSGTGLSANYITKYASFVSSYFSTTNINKQEGSKKNLTSNNMTVFATLIPIYDSQIELWYAYISEADDSDYPLGAEALNFTFDTNFILDTKLKITHTTLQSKIDDEKQNTLSKVALNGTVKKINFTTEYIQTGKDGGFVALHTEADGGFKGSNIDLNAQQDASAIHLNANINPVSNINLSLSHVDGKIRGNDEKNTKYVEETYSQITYYFTKKMLAYIRYGIYDVVEDNMKTIDRKRGRVQISYKF